MNLKIVLNQEFPFEPPKNFLLTNQTTQKNTCQIFQPKKILRSSPFSWNLRYCTWDLKMLGRVCWVRGERGHPFSRPFLQVISLEIFSPFILSWFKFMIIIMMFICPKVGCKRSLKKWYWQKEDRLLGHYIAKKYSSTPRKWGYE